MNIRLLNKEDWATFRKLRLAALFEHPEAFGSSFEEESNMSEDAFKNGFNNCDIFGAFETNQIVGCGGFFVLQQAKMRHRGVLFSMYTQSENRNNGIADTLVKSIILHAKTRVIQLHATVVTTNQTAVKLYEKNGFKIYGTEPRSLKVDDHFYDEHMMVLVF
ncbi:MAG: GNAT family N-acetyltransferase [Legionella longbeachae]|nr:GNAT family N-acetyltransferase [Legionella longbeachae]